MGGRHCLRKRLQVFELQDVTGETAAMNILLAEPLRSQRYRKTIRLNSCFCKAFADNWRAGSIVAHRVVEARNVRAIVSCPFFIAPLCTFIYGYKRHAQS